MRSGLPIEVPPYFWTIRDTGGNRAKGRYFIGTGAPIPMKTSPPSPDGRPGHPRSCGVAAERCRVVLRRAARSSARREADFANQASLAANLVDRRVQRYVDLLYGLEALSAHGHELSRARLQPPRRPRSQAGAALPRRAGDAVHPPRARRASCEAFVKAVRADRIARPPGATRASTCSPPERAPRVLGDRFRRADGGQRGGLRPRPPEPRGAAPRPGALARHRRARRAPAATAWRRRRARATAW